MKTLYMMKGLPGSGKTTEALKMMEDRADLKRINRDDLRVMIDGGKWSGPNEKFIKKLRDTLIKKALTDGYSVICDDTNLHPGNETRLRQIATECSAQFETVSFTDVDIETCIERDLKRHRSVGERVIRDMHRKFLRLPVTCPPSYDHDLPDAIIVDIDGTLAIKGDRSPYDWHRVGEDTLNEPISDLVKQYSREYWDARDGSLRYVTILVSGRDSVCHEKTISWLNMHGIRYHHLFMRPEGNCEKDSIIKRRIYDEHILGKYNVKWVFDDRNQTVSMWRSLGLTCLQVADGNF